MTIEQVVMYKTCGKIFPSAQKAQQYRENQVESFIRNAPGFQDIPYKQRVGFVQYVLDNRATLRNLLNYDDQTERDDNDN